MLIKPTTNPTTSYFTAMWFPKALDLCNRLVKDDAKLVALLQSNRNQTIIIQLTTGATYALIIAEDGSLWPSDPKMASTPLLTIRIDPGLALTAIRNNDRLTNAISLQGNASVAQDFAVLFDTLSLITLQDFCVLMYGAAPGYWLARLVRGIGVTVKSQHQALIALLSDALTYDQTLLTPATQVHAEKQRASQLDDQVTVLQQRIQRLRANVASTGTTS